MFHTLLGLALNSLRFFVFGTCSLRGAAVQNLRNLKGYLLLRFRICATRTSKLQAFVLQNLQGLELNSVFCFVFVNLRGGCISEFAEFGRACVSEYAAAVQNLRSLRSQNAGICASEFAGTCV